jgi:Sigma-70 region 2
MHDATACQAQVSLDRVEFAVRRRQRAGVTAEHGALVQPSCFLKPILRTHGAVLSRHGAQARRAGHCARSGGLASRAAASIHTSYCRGRSRSLADAEDAVAEVFLIAWRRLEDVPAGDQARPWLYAAARRVLANQARAAVRRSRLTEKLSAQRAVGQGDDGLLAERVHEALVALGPDGTTRYAGIIPNSRGDPERPPTESEILGMITSLRSGNQPGAPGGFHHGLRLQMTVGSDDLVRQLSVTYRQQQGGSPATEGNRPAPFGGYGIHIVTVAYTRLGSTPPLTAPASATDVTPSPVPTRTPTGP